MAVIQAFQLSKIYRSGFCKKDRIQALVDATLSVDQGEIFGLLGPNGAGKTTFVKILLSVVRPTSGQVELFGKSPTDIAVRERCGYLPENHRFPGFLTATQTLMLFGRLNGIRDRILRDKASSLLDLVGLKDWANQKSQKFSKGMLQRLGLAQALINDPEILFLDEPTDGVDPIGRKEMRDLFLKLRNDGITVFLNSHLLSEVEMISDRVAVLNKGTVVKTGTLEDIRGGEISHHIQVDGLLTSEQIQQLQPHASIIAANEHQTTLAVKTNQDLNQTVDMLRAWSLPLRGVIQQRSTLEDSFIKLVTPAEKP
jgi:ABC-2 type transport system ATP-binding protein